MRMVHYYLALALVLAPSLVATLVLGVWHDGTQKHLTMGLFTSILCVATNTLLILFMIVTGRVLKAAMKSRPLGPEFLAELNEFFANRTAYPVALVAASLAVATAVLGHGRFIGVPMTVHLLLGLTTVIVNLGTIQVGLRTLRANQLLLDSAASELDRIDREGPPIDERIGEPEWALGPAGRWAVFALSIWLPYFYWGLVAWRGEFARVPTSLLVTTTLVSLGALIAAWRTRMQTARKG